MTHDTERITLGEAARLAAVDRWTMRDLLADHGVEPRFDRTDADAVAAEIAAALAPDGRTSHPDADGSALD